MKILSIISVVFILLISGCSDPDELPLPKNSNSKVNSAPAGIDFSKLTFRSTYYDVVKILGTPDNESSAVPPQAQIPNTMLTYKDKGLVVFLVYDAPYQGKLDKSKSHYLGTKGFNPERVVHAIDDRSRALLDAYKFSALK